jgi:capsule polysaccharide export protein KpsE/RkpR
MVEKSDMFWWADERKAELMAENVVIEILRELQAGLSGLQADIAGLRADMAGLKHDIAGLKADVTGLKNDIERARVTAGEIRGWRG